MSLESLESLDSIVGTDEDLPITHHIECVLHSLFPVPIPPFLIRLTWTFAPPQRLPRHRPGAIVRRAIL